MQLFKEGGSCNIQVTVHFVCIVSWELALDGLSHLLCHLTSPRSHSKLQTHTYMYGHSLGTDLGHLAQPGRNIFHFV